MSDEQVVSDEEKLAGLVGLTRDTLEDARTIEEFGERLSKHLIHKRADDEVRPRVRGHYHNVEKNVKAIHCCIKRVFYQLGELLNCVIPEMQDDQEPAAKG